MLNDIVSIDTAVINELQEIMFLGSTTPTYAKVVYIDPEVEFETEDYPAVVIYRSGEINDKSRVYLPNFRSDFIYNTETNRLISLAERESPLPINFLYVVRLYYEYQEDGVELNLKLLKRFPPQPKPSYITIDNVDYDFTQMYHKLFNSTDKDYGYVENKKAKEKRIFCDQYFYLFSADLDIFDKEIYTVPTEVIIRERE